MVAALGAWLAKPDPYFDPSARAQKVLSEIYPAAAPAPLWVDGSYRPTKSAQEALAVLNDAEAEGLDPEDYRAPELLALAKKLEQGSPPLVRDAAAFDASMSLSMMRYLRHFHRGRVAPQDIGFLFSLPPDEHDYAAMLIDAARKGRVKETILSITPPLVQYRALRSMLPRYRALALTEGATFPRLPDPPKKSIKPGDSAAVLNIVRTRLMALHDLPENAPPLADPPVYDGELVEGVKRFQVRHGFEGDGVLGRTTWAALNVPIKWRVRQIELAMERMRWLPHLGARPFVAVNVPMFRLWVWDSVPETGAPSFEMGVIVGKALNTQTPVFMEEMEYVIFQPYWNVPKSILQKEILPILRRNLGYLDNQDMEMVDGQGDDARPVAATPGNVDLLAQGKLRLRQRPGPKNALGQVKFIFPNDENIYLHSTPAPESFGHARRDFSHGCIRTEDPVALAVWALKDQPEWTREKIVAAMNGEPSLRVHLTRPIRVVIYYVTAAVIPADGSVHFAEDIYGHDPRLDQALRKRQKAS
jgi:L,D-transpeptidase YcbB